MFSWQTVDIFNGRITFKGKSQRKENLKNNAG